MNKEDAAKFLGVSVRTLQRYTKQQRIGVTYKHGKSGAEADYEEEELRRFKEELESTTYTPAASETQALVATQARPLVAAGAERLAAALEALQPSTQPAVPVADKLILDLREAQALTHLSRTDLLSAINARKLKAAKRGRGWKIKRADLDAYVQKL